MKYIEIYENFNVGKLKIGDYVICEDNDFFKRPIKEFVDNTIGVIEDSAIIDGEMNYSIRYKNIPAEIVNWFSLRGCRIYYKEHIKYWSNNRKELEEILLAKKYNL